jgi:hypothetical protein
MALELEVLEYRIVYRYSAFAKIEIYKVGLDWGWTVRNNGDVLRSDLAGSESEAERAALEYAKGC